MKYLIVLLFAVSACISQKSVSNKSHTEYTPTNDTISAPYIPVECEHFYVKQSFPINGEYDKEFNEVRIYVESIDGLPCICIYCKTIKTCY